MALSPRVIFLGCAECCSCSFVPHDLIIGDRPVCVCVRLNDREKARDRRRGRTECVTRGPLPPAPSFSPSRPVLLFSGEQPRDWCAGGRKSISVDPLNELISCSQGLCVYECELAGWGGSDFALLRFLLSVPPPRSGWPSSPPIKLACARRLGLSAFLHSVPIGRELKVPLIERAFACAFYSTAKE